VVTDAVAGTVDEGEVRERGEFQGRAQRFPPPPPHVPPSSSLGASGHPLECDGQ
jgi:hypothetical protein